MTIDSIRQAEKKAMEAERSAEAEAQQALAAAKEKADEILSGAVYSSKDIIQQHIDEAQKEANAYIAAELDKARSGLEQLKKDVELKEKEAVSSVIDTLIK